MTNQSKCGTLFFLLFMIFLPLCYIIINQDSFYISTMNYIGQYSNNFTNSESSNRSNDSLQVILLTSTSNKQVTLEEEGSPAFLNSRPVIKSFENNPSVLETGAVFVDLKNIRKSTQNVFFIESKCATDKLAKEVTSGGSISLNPRQTCAVESSAVTNPGRDIYILYTCPLGDDFLEGAPEYVRKLLDLPNVRLVLYNMTEMFTGTPVEGLVARKGLEESSFPIEHASDVLRLTILWKYGGTYCDLDVVVIRSLDDLKNNFCGLESDNTIGSAVLNFKPDGLGHEVLTKALDHINNHFDGSRWTANGPDIVTKFVLQACNVKLENVTSCHRMTVFNHTVLYPIYWWNHLQLFDDKLGPDIVDYVKKSSYIVHFWNKQSHSNKIVVGSTQAYGLLAGEFCPRVYSSCGNHF